MILFCHAELVSASHLDFGIDLTSACLPQVGTLECELLG
jgi:hypothetical protein